MEVGESRNKRYVNSRNGAVYSSHKKANKIFFRSGRYTPGPSSVPTPSFRSPPRDSFLPPEKWQRINRRWDKECETTWPGMERGRNVVRSLLSSYSPSRRRIFRSREKSFYILPGIDLASSSPTHERDSFFIGVASCAIHPIRRDFHVSERGWRMRRVIVKISVKRGKMDVAFL